MPLMYACYGSDNGRIAVAGGTGEDDEVNSNVFVLGNPNSSWGSLDVTQPTARYLQAGLLIGDVLLCLGGLEDQVSQVYQLCVLRPNSTKALLQICCHC